MTATQMQLAERNFSYSEEAEVANLYRECHDFAHRAWQPFLQEATRDMMCFLGDQWEAHEKASLAEQRRNALVFNRVRRNIKMVTGFERKSRHSIVAQPVENSDEKTADQLSAVLLWVMNRDNMLHTMSDAFEGCLKTGINLLQLSVDYQKDPLDGDIKLARVPHNQVLLDPRFTRRDLSDCEFILQRRLLSREAVKALLPQRSDDIDMLKGTARDGRFPNMADASFRGAKDVLRYDEFWRRTYREERQLINRETGQIVTLEKGQIQRGRDFSQAFPEWHFVTRQIPTVVLSILVEEVPLWIGEDPWGIGDFPHVPVMAFWDPEHSTNNSGNITGPVGQDDLSNFFSRQPSGDFSLKLQSLVRCSRDPQTESNKRRSKMLDILDSQVNTGWQAKSGAVVNPKDLYQSGQGRVVWMKDDAQMTDAQRLPPADIPAGLFNLSQQFDNDIVEIAGITDELLGMADDGNLQMSGVLAKLRQGAGITVLQDLFDNYRLAQKLVGNKMMAAVQANFSSGKVARIINEEPTPEFSDKSFGVYDAVVQEAMETPTQRALAYTQLLQARQIGIPIPDSVIIDFMPLQDKDALRTAMDQEAEKQQLVQQQQLEDQARLRELQRAKVFSDVGLGVERIARAEADRGLAVERVSELQENNSMAVLNRVKAVKEIESMDDARLIRLLDFFKSLEQDQTQSNLVAQRTQENKANQELAAALAYTQDASALQPGVQ